ncbi:MAG: pyruvate, phosphate dikinase, partial [Candidatus Latescibacterota bacterium]
MKEQTQSAIRLLEALTERAKELTCLYAIEETLREPDADIDHVCESIIEAIPPGWQFPDSCVAQITLEGREYRSREYQETPWKLSANIVQQDQVVGTIEVCYTEETPAADIGPFLKEEKKLIETIADRLNHFLTYKKMKHVFQEWQTADRDPSETGRGDWESVLDLIRQTDNALFLRISNKMLNHLCWSGIEEAENLRRADERQDIVSDNLNGDDIKGQRLSRLLDFSTEFTEKIFRIAASHLGCDEILSRIQMWIQEDKLGALLRTVRRRLPLSEVSGSLRRYFFTTREETYDRYPLARGLKVLLIECILSNRLDYIETAKDHVDIDDLYHLLQNVVFSPESHGKLGGKSAGLFLASQILKRTDGGASSDSPFRIPKTWYVASDVMLEFIHYNNMDEIIEQKYKDIERVRLEYPHVIEMFQQTVLPAEMLNGL